MSFFKTLDNGWQNARHVVRFFCEKVVLQHDGNYRYHENGKDELICVLLSCVTTENIKSDCFLPIAVGYFESLEDAENWILDPEFSSEPLEKLIDFIPPDLSSEEQENHMLAHVLYKSIGEDDE